MKCGMDGQPPRRGTGTEGRGEPICAFCDYVL